MEEPLFTKEELARYNRHIIIDSFGTAAQEKLKKSRVLVVGAGGLGSPLLLYLAAAGIGHIGIVDCDVVEDSNLQRQVLYRVEDIGKPKAQTAMQRLSALNPYIHFQVYPEQLSAANALEIIRDYDVVADGTDNFPTRYLVNDACVLLDKINVHASIYQFEGQVCVFNADQSDGTRGPNYRDLYPMPPEPGLIASCAEAGVLGVLPGIIGSMQALEVIKVLAEIGDCLIGRFFAFDALSFTCRTFNIRKNPDNPISGNQPSITQLIDYEQFCGVPAIERKVKGITASALYLWLQTRADIQLIDVREQDEYALANIGAELIPLAMISAYAHQIDKHKMVIILCKTGHRSAKAIRLLEDQYGFTNLYNLEGGLLNYFEELKLGLPAE